MKVIDLLTKIVNSEPLPYRIKYNENIYFYDLDLEWYIREDLKNELFIDRHHLRDNIEIIVENSKLNDIREKYGLPRIKDKKIPKKIEYIFNLGYIDTNDKNLVIKEVNKTINDLYKKYNEIIDYLEGISNERRRNNKIM